MTQLVPQPKPPQATAGQVQKLLQRTDDVMLKPWRLRDAMSESYPEAWKAAYDREVPDVSAMRHRAHGARAREQAQAILDQLPLEPALRECLVEIQALEAMQPDAAQARLLIAVMVDAFPNARPHSPTVYLEALVHEVVKAGFKAPVVAKACSVVRSTNTFPPSPAEFLETCRKSILTSHAVEQALVQRQKIEAALAEADRLGPLEPIDVGAMLPAGMLKKIPGGAKTRRPPHNTAGKPDAGGLTAEMRALMAKLQPQAPSQPQPRE